MRVEEIREALEAGAVLLTPNLRSARLWRSRFAGAVGKPSIVSSSVLPWRAWTASLWQEGLLRGLDDRILLNEMQSASVWEEVVRAAEPDTLRPVRSLVQLCMRTEALVHGYLAADRLLSGTFDEMYSATDADHFRIWFRRHSEICEAERLLPPAGLEAALSQDRMLRSLPASQTRHVMVLGMDWLVPAQERLLSSLQKSGGVVDRVTGGVCAPGGSDRDAMREPRLLRCDTEREEMLLLARSLRRELETGTARSIAVIVPDLDSSRNALERMMREVVAPEMRDVALAQQTPPWEFSSGVPLLSLPVVADAMRLLRWTVSALPVGEVSSLLQSPYIAWPISPDEAAELDAQVLRRGGRLRPDWTVEALAWSCRDRAPELRERLLSWMRIVSEAIRGEQSHGRWSETARLLLTEAGWPGVREQTSTEFQSMDRWGELLDDIASLSIFDRPLSFRDFLGALEDRAAAMLFAPANTDAPIQIMTMEEAQGCTFDRLWFPHADEGRVNAKAVRNPLLTWPLQLAMGMPGTRAAEDAAQKNAAVQGIAVSATEVWFSYGASNPEGAVRPSSIVQSLPGLVGETVRVEAEDHEEIVLEPYEVDAPVPWVAEGVVSGGVEVLKSQAACSFRAFAEKRLFSTGIETPDLGLNFRERGTLVHRVLGDFWNEVVSRETLLRLQADGDLQRVLAFYVDQNLPPAAKQDGWSRAYVEVQRERLQRLLTQWLRYEADRPAFVVLEHEKKVPGAVIGPLRMDLRVDRVDEVKMGDEVAAVLIDYKTGGCKDAKNWQGDRPDEPQLPSYAMAAGIEHVRAIAFGMVRPGARDMGLQSFPRRSSSVHADGREEAEAFRTELTTWRTTLEQLARDFAAGGARVEPKEYPVTCAFCAQRMLCRLNPEVLEAEAEEDALEAMD